MDDRDKEFLITFSITLVVAIITFIVVPILIMNDLNNL